MLCYSRTKCKKVGGRKEVTVNLLSNSMVVSYDEDKVNNQTIIDTVVKAGYQAALEQKNNQKKASAHRTFHLWNKILKI